MLTKVDTRRTGLAEVLHTEGPAPGDAEVLHVFGRFVGSWSLHWFGQDASGEAAKATGELHVGWVLGGRATQDVWIVPGRGEPGHARPPTAFYGSTIRFYDAQLGAWRSTWIEPVNGRVRTFVGREQGSDIVLVSLDGAPLLRWRFTDIADNRFTWWGEYSVDEGRTWLLEERMEARRLA
jgi:hypothetical protein